MWAGGSGGGARRAHATRGGGRARRRPIVQYAHDRARSGGAGASFRAAARKLGRKPGSAGIGMSVGTSGSERARRARVALGVVCALECEWSERMSA